MLRLKAQQKDNQLADAQDELGTMFQARLNALEEKQMLETELEKLRNNQQNEPKEENKEEVESIISNESDVSEASIEGIDLTIDKTHVLEHKIARLKKTVIKQFPNSGTRLVLTSLVGKNSRDKMWIAHGSYINLGTAEASSKLVGSNASTLNSLNDKLKIANMKLFLNKHSGRKSTNLSEFILIAHPNGILKQETSDLPLKRFLKICEKILTFLTDDHVGKVNPQPMLQQIGHIVSTTDFIRVVRTYTDITKFEMTELAMKKFHTEQF